MINARATTTRILQRTAADQAALDAEISAATLHARRCLLDAAVELEYLAALNEHSIGARGPVVEAPAEFADQIRGMFDRF